MLTVETMNINQARRFVVLRDTTRMTWEEMAALYECSVSSVKRLSEHADLMVLHADILQAEELLASIERRLSEAYAEYLEAVA